MGSIAGDGNIVNGVVCRTAGGDNTSTTYNGVLSGVGGLEKDGSGTLTLSGANTYTGSTTISAGTLQVSGTLSDSTDVINSGTYDVDAVTQSNR